MTAFEDLRKALDGKSLLLFDDGLISRDGHWFEIDLAIVRLHIAQGVSVTVACHSRCTIAAEFEQAGARVLPVVEHSLWDGWQPVTRFSRLAKAVPGLAFAAEIASVFRQAKAHAAVLERLLRDDAYDCVFHPTALAADLLAWSLIPRRLRRRAGLIALSTFYPLGTYRSSGPASYPRRLAWWRWMVLRLRREFASGKLRFFTDSPRLADEFRTRAGVPASVLSSPRQIPEMPHRQIDPKRLVFGSLGAARWEKGIHHLLAAIEELLHTGNDTGLHFIVQWNRTVADPAGLTIEQPARARIEYRDATMTSQDYQATLSEIDCMVLPYLRERYQSRSSAVALEAAAAGMPMIYTADTWLDDFVREQGAGIAVPDGDVAALAAAIAAMRDGFPAYKAAAVERSPIAGRANSPEAFLRTLWNPPAAKARSAR